MRSQTSSPNPLSPPPQNTNHNFQYPHEMKYKVEYTKNLNGNIKTNRMRFATCANSFYFCRPAASVAGMKMSPLAIFKFKIAYLNVDMSLTTLKLLIIALYATLQFFYGHLLISRWFMPARKKAAKKIIQPVLVDFDTINSHKYNPADPPTSHALRLRPPRNSCPPPKTRIYASGEHDF